MMICRTFWKSAFRSSAVVVILAATLAARPSFANFSNYNSILIGDQAAGMGGAATAMTEDASGMAWYNPAGLAKLQGQSFSAAVGIYKKFDTRYNAESDLTKSSLTVNQGFFRALPSSTGSVVRPKQVPYLEDWTVALSILVPEYETFRGDIAEDGESSSNLMLTTESIWVGGAMSRELNATDSWGFTVYYTARSVSKTVNDRTYIDATHSKVFIEERNLTQNGVVGILGWHRDLTPNWKLGVTYRLPSLPVAGTAQIKQTVIENGAITTPVNESSLDTKARIPWKATVGVAYVTPGVSRWAADVSTYEAMSYDDVEKEEIAEHLEHKPIWNVSLGYEKEWVSWLRTRFGLFSNFSAHPDPEVGKVSGQGDHVDQAGFSANLAFKSGNIEYTFGGYYVGGRGRSVQRVKQVDQEVTKIQNVFTMLVGTSYSF